jgi:type VI secretion system secreted protein VgrG
VEIQAPEVKIATKGAQANFGGGAITQQCSGAHIIKSATFAHTKGGNGSVSEVKFPSTKMETDERVILHHSQTGKPVAGRRYSLHLPDGSSIDGVTDELGRTDLATSDEMGNIEIVIHPEDETGD